MASTGQGSPWTGWYDQDAVYGPRQELNTFLEQTGSKLSGSGGDKVGQFTWEGEISSNGQVVLRKKYVGGKPHDQTIVYTGNRSVTASGKEVIDGSWSWTYEDGGSSWPFHIERHVAPPAGKVSIRSTQNPNAYLRLGSGTVNLQLGRTDSASFQLVPLEVVAGEQVYGVQATASRLYVHLDPTVSAQQAPAAGSTFHPKGVGFTKPVQAVDAHSKFTLVVKQAVDGVVTHSLKLLNPGKAVFLRLDADKLTAGSGGGEVNGQTYVGRFERLLIEPFP